MFFFFNDTATPEISPLPLPDALPIPTSSAPPPPANPGLPTAEPVTPPEAPATPSGGSGSTSQPPAERSEEHTSELQSHLNLVCRLLLEKKNNKQPHAHDAPT